MAQNLKPSHRNKGALFSIFLLSLMPGIAVMAGDNARYYHIPAQSLNNALMQFATDSHLELMFTAEKIRGLRTDSVDGSLTPAQALSQLLQGSGMTYRFVDAKTVTVEAPDANFRKTANVEETPESQSNSDTTLPKVTVEADADVYDPAWDNDINNPNYQRSHASTATKTDTPLLETPATVQVVPRKLIQDRGMQKPNDLAEVVAGVQPIVGYGNAPSQWFLIRGFSNGALNYRNGFRLTEVYTPRDLANVERVEFVKGPASVLYGTNQPGGSVNTVTKKPLDIDFISTNLTGGSFDRFRGTIDANKKIGNLGLRLNVAGDTADSYFDFENSQNWFIAPVVTYQITPDTKIMYEAEFQETKQNGWSNGLPNLSDSLSLPVNRTLSEPFTYLNNFNHTHHIEFEHRFNEDWKFRQGLYYSRTDRSFLSINSDFSRNPSEPITNLSRFAYQEPDEHQENAVSQTELYGHFKTGEVDHQVLAGFERIHSLFGYVGDFNFYDGGLNLVNPSYNGTVPGKAVSFGSQDTADSYGIYLQDQVKWGNWRLLAGWRHDEVETGRKDPLSGSSEGQSDDSDTGRVGLLYTISPSTSVYYSFSQSFVPNLGIDRNGKLFDADRGTQHEIGLKHSIWKGLDFTLSLFDILRENVVVPVPGTNFRVSNGDQRSRGIETSLTGEVTDDFHIITNLTFLDATVEKADSDRVGDRLYGVPRFSANAWGLYDMPLTMIPGKLSAGFGIVHVGEREATLPNFNLNLPAYTRFDMGLFYKYEKLRLALNLRNLTDEKYYETLENFAVQRQAPFNWAVTVGYDF